MTTHELPGSDLMHDVGDRVRGAVDEVKPRLRGWLHATTAPLTAVTLAAVLLVVDATRERAAAAVFLASAVGVFTTSAVLHVRSWSPRAQRVWQRIDHAGIFLLIAGSATPFAVLVLPPREATQMMTVMWSGALAGALFKVLWIDAPRRLAVGLYLLLGSTTVLFAPALLAHGPHDVLLLALAGGIVHALGGLVYAFRWPDPRPAFFGFHEVFHALTVVAFGLHGLGVALLVSR